MIVKPKSLVVTRIFLLQGGHLQQICRLFMVAIQALLLIMICRVYGTSPAVCSDFPTVPRTSSPDCDNFVVPSSKISNPCPVASSSHEELQNDLGIFIQANKPVEDVIATIIKRSTICKK